MPSLVPGSWPRYPVIYEINTRIWLRELSARAGKPLTLGQIPLEEVDRIAELGFHAVWLVGVWTTGPQAVQIARTHPDLQAEYRQALPDYTPEDCIGSPYSIASYTVAPGLGGPAALAALREKLARRGLRLVLDFVPNHTASEHLLVNERPEAFVQGSQEDLARQPPAFFRNAQGLVIAHGRDPYFPPWTDTAQINYAHPAGREAMLKKLLMIAAQCDGVRCDMTMLILPDIFKQTWGKYLGPNPVNNSFWREAIPQVLNYHSDFLFLAETYWNLEWRLQQEGFHFTYDKTLYDRLVHYNFDGVRQHLRAERSFQDRCARFIENHDEPRAAEAFGPARARSAAAVSFFTPGLKLLHEGQLEGRHVKVPIQLRRRPPEPEDVETAIFYERILGVLRDSLFQEGAFRLLAVNSAGWGDASFEALTALCWSPHGGKPCRRAGYIVVTNLSGSRAYGRVPLPAGCVTAGSQYTFYDHLTAKQYERDGNELLLPGLYVALEAHQTHLFEVTQK